MRVRLFVAVDYVDTSSSMVHSKPACLHARFAIRVRAHRPSPAPIIAYTPGLSLSFFRDFKPTLAAFGCDSADTLVALALAEG